MTFARVVPGLEDNNRVCFWQNDVDLHMEQAEGFSPVCVRSCGATDLLSLNDVDTLDGV